MVTLEPADLTEPELRQEILKLRRRVEKLAALLRLALALLHASGFTWTGWFGGRGTITSNFAVAPDIDRETNLAMLKIFARGTDNAV